jgi:RHS repeat-associated protein
VLEERVGASTSADSQYLWGVRYVDDLVLRDRGSERLYSLSDALFNVVALTDATGAVKERFAYQPYGQSEELNPNFTSYSGTDYQWTYRFTGRELDLESGLQLNRNRYLHQQLGRWVSRDPIERMLLEEGLIRIGRSGLLIMSLGVISTAERVNLYEAHFVPNGLDPTGLIGIYPWTPPGGPIDKDNCNWVNWMTGSCCTAFQTTMFRIECQKKGKCLETSFCSAKKRFNAFSCGECDASDRCSFDDCDAGKPCGESGTRSCQWEGVYCGCFAGGGLDDCE